jgi:hypothetical protein
VVVPADEFQFLACVVKAMTTETNSSIDAAGAGFQPFTAFDAAAIKSVWAEAQCIQYTFVPPYRPGSFTTRIAPVVDTPACLHSGQKSKQIPSHDQSTAGGSQCGLSS